MIHTEELKVFPMQKYIAELDDEATVYQGIRAQESPSRAAMPDREWSDVYDCEVVRPLFRMTWQEVFEMSQTYNIPPNPLYKSGASRVGCFPCIMVNHGELRRMTLTHPDLWDRIDTLEQTNGGRSFFKPNYIPERFHDMRDPKSNKSYPSWRAVKAYLFRKDIDREDLERWEREKPATCMSIYNLCE